MTAMTKIQGLATAAGFALALAVGGAGYASAEDVVLHMAVPDWPPTRIMKDMFDKEYKPASGNKVTLDVDFIPWPDFYTRVNASLTSGEKKYNMAVSDSQWLGAFVEGGYFRKINDLWKLLSLVDSLASKFFESHHGIRDEAGFFLRRF